MEDRTKLFSYADGSRFEEKELKEVFTTIHSERTWDEASSGESVSGSGSSRGQTRLLFDLLPEVIRSYQIKSILDIPCGDFYWMQDLVQNVEKYIGADIVKELIEKNKKKFLDEHLEFINLDLTKDPLPKADLLLCRDCLVHLSFDDCKKAIKNIKRSGCQYLLVTTFTDQLKNEDIITGGWRPLNMQLEPFLFPAPQELINEGCTEMGGVFHDKSLGLWKLAGKGA